jgi:SAM-dependent methyltransferase
MRAATFGAWEPLLRSSCGRTIALDVHRWLGEVQPEEHEVLDRAVGPVLDVGCGPARHVLALRARGIPALGIDNARSAIALARRRGAEVLERSVFDRLPGEGRWKSALLLDGNIGIGGDPGALLARLGTVLGSGGRLLVELEPPGGPTSSLVVRTETGDAVSHWFEWAQLAADRVDDVARKAGFDVCEQWHSQDRWFAQLDVSGTSVRSLDVGAAQNDEEVA